MPQKFQHVSYEIIMHQIKEFPQWYTVYVDNRSEGHSLEGIRVHKDLLESLPDWIQIDSNQKENNMHALHDRPEQSKNFLIRIFKVRDDDYTFGRGGASRSTIADPDQLVDYVWVPASRFNYETKFDGHGDVYYQYWLKNTYKAQLELEYEIDWNTHDWVFAHESELEVDFATVCRQLEAYKKLHERLSGHKIL